MSNYTRMTLYFILTLILGGCANGNRSLVVLSPGQDGKTGAITVSNPAGSVDINSPYQATTIKGKAGSPPSPTAMSKESIDALFANAISIQPMAPVHYILNFEKDLQLNSDSTALLSVIIAAIKERNSIDVSVVGHADSVGSKEFNMTLSKNRANSVKDQLIHEGVNPDYIQTSSHGSQNPLIKTADNVNEPKNRRVEVVVR